MTENLPVTTDGIESLIDSGLIYAYKRDKSFRPVLIMNMKKILKTEESLENLLRLTMYWVECLINDGMIAGKVENWFCIVDCEGVGVTEIPKKKLEAMVGVMTSNYRGRLFKMFAVNTPILLRAFYKVIKGWIDPFTSEKIKVRAGVKKFSADLDKFIDPESREEKYGGTLPNKTDNFYPPELK